MKEILENIRRIRLEKRFKTKELAEKLGMTPPNYASIEAGRVPLTVDRLKEIAVILGVNYVDLLNGTANSGNGAGGASSEELERLKEEIMSLKKERKQLEKLLELTESNYDNLQDDYWTLSNTFDIFSLVVLELLKHKPELQSDTSEIIIDFIQKREKPERNFQKKYSIENVLEALQSRMDEVIKINDRVAGKLIERVNKLLNEK